MGDWVMSADLLARARFVVSPMADVVAVLGSLSEPRGPTDRATVALHGTAFRTMLAEHPGRAAVLQNIARPGWLADFLCLPPPTDQGRAPLLPAFLCLLCSPQVREQHRVAIRRVAHGGRALAGL